MNARSTVLLGGVAVVVLGLGLYYGTGQQAEAPPAMAARPAFPDLAAKLAGAQEIEVTQAGKELHLARSGDTWTIAEKAKFPADPSRVHELLAALAGLRLEEARTANPEDYGKLGLADPPKEAPKEGADSDGTLVRVLGADKAALAQVVLGHSRGDGLYVRLPGAAQSWYALGHLTPTADPMDWLDKTIADIPADKIAGVTITHGAETLQLAREGKALVVKAPADHPPLDEAKVGEVAHALESLSFDDVKPLPAPGTADATAAFTTTDGETLTATVNKEGSDLWASFAATGTDKAKDAAQALEARLHGWAFKLGGWHENALVPSLDTLKAPPPPPAKAASPAAPATPPAPAAPK